MELQVVVRGANQTNVSESMSSVSALLLSHYFVALSLPHTLSLSLSLAISRYFSPPSPSPLSPLSSSQVFHSWNTANRTITLDETRGTFVGVQNSVVEGNEVGVKVEAIHGKVRAYSTGTRV